MKVSLVTSTATNAGVFYDLLTPRVQRPPANEGHDCNHSAMAGFAAHGWASAFGLARRKSLRIVSGERGATNSPTATLDLFDNDHRHWTHVLAFDGLP
jgi:hypothetical protein